MSPRPLLALPLVPVPTRHYSARERELGTPSSAGYPAIRRERVPAQNRPNPLPITSLVSLEQFGSTGRSYRGT